MGNHQRKIHEIIQSLAEGTSEVRTNPSEANYEKWEKRIEHAGRNDSNSFGGLIIAFMLFGLTIYWFSTNETNQQASQANATIDAEFTVAAAATRDSMMTATARAKKTATAQARINATATARSQNVTQEAIAKRVTPTPTITNTPAKKLISSPQVDPAVTPQLSNLIIPDSYYHSFDFDDGIWDIGYFPGEYADEETSLINGKYRYTATPKQDRVSFIQCPWQYQFSNISISVDAWPVAGPYPLNYGIGFRQTDFDNYYLFELNNMGEYRVTVEKVGNGEVLLDWTYSSAINNGGNNPIKIKADNSTIEFYVNDQYLTTIYDDKLTNGMVCFWIKNYKDKIATTIDFDNLSITSLP